MLTITTERKGEWYVARSGFHEYTAPDRMMAFREVLRQLMGKGLITYS